MKRSTIVITILLLIVLVLLYLTLPYKWLFGLRPPKNYQECLQGGGVKRFDIKVEPCEYKGKIFYMTAEALKK